MHRIFAVLFATLTTTLAAQQPVIEIEHTHHAGALVHYGKWGTLALSGALMALGAHEHAQSNRLFSELVSGCQANNALCTLSPDGTYLSPSSEQLYQNSLHFDSRARLRLLLGQATLVATAALFIADLRHKGGGPDNIPFHPEAIIVAPGANGALLGLRFPL